MNLNPIRVVKSTVLADARPGGAMPPIDRARVARVTTTRVGVEVAGGDSWRIWIPLALVPVGGLVGFGAATLLGLRACARIAVALGGGLALGAVGAATISLGRDGRRS